MFPNFVFYVRVDLFRFWCWMGRSVLGYNVFLVSIILQTARCPFLFVVAVRGCNPRFRPYPAAVLIDLVRHSLISEKISLFSFFCDASL